MSDQVPFTVHSPPVKNVRCPINRVQLDSMHNQHVHGSSAYPNVQSDSVVIEAFEERWPLRGPSDSLRETMVSWNDFVFIGTCLVCRSSEFRNHNNSESEFIETPFSRHSWFLLDRVNPSCVAVISVSEARNLLTSLTVAVPAPTLRPLGVGIPPL